MALYDKDVVDFGKEHLIHPHHTEPLRRRFQHNVY